jgi:DNA-binding LacI/PurR family transcriptional regulator
VNKCTIYILIEPNYLTPVWYSKSLDGLKDKSTKEKLSYAQLNSVEEFSDKSDVTTAIVVSTNDEWTRQTVQQLQKRNIRPILIGAVPSQFGEDVSGMLFNRKSSIESMLHYFHSCNRERVALMGINANASSEMLKCESFLSASRFLNSHTGYSDIYFSNPKSSNPSEVFFSNIDRYDGVICSNDYVAAYVLNEAKNLGVRIPEDLFVAGIGNISLCQYTAPTLTSATRFYYETGEQSVSIWEQLNSNPHITSIVTTVECKIICRGSTGFSPLPKPIVFSDNSPPKKCQPTKMIQASMAIRGLENCLIQCDQLDMKIIKGLINNIKIEDLSEQLFVVPGTVKYRLKKIYTAANVSSKTEFVRLFKKYITNDKIFEDFSKMC